MSINFRLFLLPFNLLYGAVVFLRNKFYDWGLLKSVNFDLPIICVGNLAVGGSGKTPTTEYLVHLLANDHKIAILSRGYGRKTKGFFIADKEATAETIGDEPLQYFRKFKHITVAVCEDRVKGINLLKNTHDLILLDDAYQHRAVKAGFNILLFEFAKLKTWQTLLPAGNLREPFSGIKRSQMVLVTKSPAQITAADQNLFAEKLKLNAQQMLAYSHIVYQAPLHLYDGTSLNLNKETTVFMLSGIANPAPLKAYLSSVFAEVIPFEYPDHHQFTGVEISALVNAFRNHPADKKIIITTEKDGQRLLDNNLRDLLLNLPIYYLPIAIEIDQNNQADFNQKILAYVARTKRRN